MRIALGSDHHGVLAIRRLVDHVRELGHEPVLLGNCDGNACDYPDEAWLVGQAIVSGAAELGVLVCGSGIGITMAANKVPGIRAALAVDAEAAEMSRRHNDANVLCFAGKRASDDDAVRMLDAFLAAPFEGGRHARRVAKLALIEQGHDPRGA